MTVVTICGEKFSSNLGDGAIADCLEWLIRSVRPDIDVRTLDMSRKSEFSAKPSAMPAAGKPFSPVRRMLPGFLRRGIREAQWAHGHGPLLEQHSEPILSGSDALIIGGGQLLMDNNLRFPMKIRSVTAAAARAGVVQSACFGVGVGGKWSNRGKQILLEALGRPALASLVVRDESSAATIRKEFGTLADRCDVAGDPALFCMDVYADAGSNTNDGLIGLGVLGMRLLAGYVDDPRASDRSEIVAFWLAVIDEISAAGHRAELFTNGDEHDHVFAEHIAQANRDRGGPEVRVAPRPTTPAGLVSQIGCYSGTIAYRLHSSIIAYSLRIPGTLLTWDKKVRHFAEMTGRPGHAFPGIGANPGEVVRLTLDAMREGLDETVWNATREQVRSSLARLLDQLVGAAR